MVNETDPTTHFVPTVAGLPHPLGRHVHHDPRNLAHRALVVTPDKTTTPGRAWPTRRVFDQGDEPRCTTEAAVGLLVTNPYRPQFAADFRQYDSPVERQQLYLASQDVDPWPGHDYDGTSTDAPFKVLRDRGQISAWRWLFGEDELWTWVTDYGPAVVGTKWLMGMFYPNAAGYLTVEGSEVGGHAYRIVQAHQRRQAYRIVNSWGRGWGQGGRAWIGRNDLAHLLADQGDAVTVA